MPDRFVKNKWFIKAIYIIILFSLIGLMFATYFIGDFMIIRKMGIVFNFAYLPFIIIAGLFGYFLALNSYFILFVVAVMVSRTDAYLLTPYMVTLYLFSMLSQYRWFRSKFKTILAFFITYFLNLLFEFFYNDMILAYDFEAGRIINILRHVTTPVFSCFLGCLFFYIFFNYAPDSVKRIFPLGYMYTREYVKNLLFQNTLKKTRISIKITAIIIIEALLLGAFSILFIRILFPDLRGMINQGMRQSQQIGQDLEFRYNNYGLAFTIKMMFMELSIAVPIASTINFYAKTRIGTPIGQLSSFMLKFTDTTDENRTEYLQTIKNKPFNTRDEITDLYHSMMITLNEVTGYIEHIQEEQKLKENLRVAEAASEAKSSFLSNMSHEIRTPINAVLGMNEMILRESEEPQTIEYANTIQSAGNTLLSLVNDILDFSKIEAGKMEILPVQYNLSSVINDLVNMITRRAKDKNLEFKINVDENIPDLLFGDEIRIKQCATNILTNAVKYTEKGSVTLEFSYENIDDIGNKSSNTMGDKTGENSVSDESAESGSDSYIALTVRVIDTGIGIKEEDIQKLYSPFERIEEIRNRTIEGTGLGMSIVKKLLAMMNSRLVVNSVYGEGSDFSFTIIQKVCNSEPIGDFEKRYKEIVSTRKTYRESFTAPTAKILVVDDTSMNLTVIRGLLKRTLLQIVTAESGKETLGLVTREKYDLIFLDHRMPEMDGIETLSVMDKLDDNLNRDTICIALTANAVTGAREFYLNAGFADYLSKPIDASRLENMLIQYLPKEKVILTDFSEENSTTVNDPANADSENADDSIKADTHLNTDISKSRQKLMAYKGINIEEAIKNCGGEDIAAEVIEDFKANLPEKVRLISEYESTWDIKNFTIQVHSLKSSARIIGAGDLSRQAEALEMMGNEWLEKNDSPDINETSDVLEANESHYNTIYTDEKIHAGASVLLNMLDEYMGYFGLSRSASDNSKSSGNSSDGSSIVEAASKAVSEESSDQRPVIPADELTSAFDSIRELMEAFDYDNAASIYKMLEDYRIPSESTEKYELLGKYLAAVDREKVLELLG